MKEPNNTGKINGAKLGKRPFGIGSIMDNRNWIYLIREEAKKYRGHEQAVIAYGHTIEWLDYLVTLEEKYFNELNDGTN